MLRHLFLDGRRAAGCCLPIVLLVILLVLGACLLIGLAMGRASITPGSHPVSELVGALPVWISLYSRVA